MANKALKGLRRKGKAAAKAAKPKPRKQNRKRAGNAGGRFSSTVSERAASAPVNTSNRFQRRSQDTLVISDTAIFPIQTANFVSPFTTQQITLFPNIFPFARDMAQLYGRFSVLNARYKYKSQTPSTVGGSVWHAFDANPDQKKIPLSLTDAQHLNGFTMRSAFDSSTRWSVVPNVTFDREYITHPDENHPTDTHDVDLAPGNFIFGTVGFPQPSVTVGYLEMQATFKFSARKLPADRLGNDDKFAFLPAPSNQTALSPNELNVNIPNGVTVASREGTVVNTQTTGVALIASAENTAVNLSDKEVKVNLSKVDGVNLVNPLHVTEVSLPLELQYQKKLEESIDELRRELELLKVQSQAGSETFSENFD